MKLNFSQNKDVKEVSDMAKEFKREFSMEQVDLSNLDEDQLKFALSYRNRNPDKWIQQYTHVKNRINEDQVELLKKELYLSIINTRKKYNKPLLDDEMEKDRERYHARILREDTKAMAEARKRK